jgi:hypothetical protein
VLKVAVGAAVAEDLHGEEFVMSVHSDTLEEDPRHVDLPTHEPLLEEASLKLDLDCLY